MMKAFDLYYGAMEKKIVEKTAYFYQMQSRDLLKKYEIPDYLRVVLSIIDTESQWSH
jgi:hypothetical protein